MRNSEVAESNDGKMRTGLG